MVDERVHGLGNTHHAREHDAPRVGAVESAGGGDGNGAEQDGCREGHESDVSAGDVLLERLHERGHDQRHESGPERGHGADIRIILLRRCRRPTASTPTKAGSASEKDGYVKSLVDKKDPSKGLST